MNIRIDMSGNSYYYDIGYDPTDLEYVPLSPFFIKGTSFTVAKHVNPTIYSLTKRIQSIVDTVIGLPINFHSRFLYFSARKGYEDILLSNNVILNTKKDVLFTVVTKKYSNIKLTGYDQGVIEKRHYSNLEIWIDKDFSNKYPIVYKDFIKYILSTYSSEIDIKYLRDINCKIFKSKRASELYSNLITVDSKLEAIRKELLGKVFTNTDSIDLKLAETLNSKIVSTGDEALMAEFGIAPIEEQELGSQLVEGDGYSETVGVANQMSIEGIGTVYVSGTDPIIGRDFTTLSTASELHLLSTSVSEPVPAFDITFIDDLAVPTVPVTFIDDLTPTS